MTAAQRWGVLCGLWLSAAACGAAVERMPGPAIAPRTERSTQLVESLVAPSRSILQGLGARPNDNAVHVAHLRGETPPAFVTTVLRLEGRADAAFFEQLDAHVRAEVDAGRLVVLDLRADDLAACDFAHVARIAETLLLSAAPVFVRLPDAWQTSPRSAVAFQRALVATFRRAGAEHVAFIWSIDPVRSPTSFMAWYPGDDAVDWFGLDLSGSRAVFVAPPTEALLDEAATRRRPVFLTRLVCDRVPIGTTDAEARVAIAEWFGPLRHFVTRHDVIRAMAYEPTPAWQGGAGEIHRDAHIDRNETLMHWWRQWLRAPRFVGAEGVGAR